MSKQRIPRWLTEGISVYEEGRKRPEWGRDMEVTFASAMDKGKVLKLRDLNAGFTKPDTIRSAYYEASLLVDHIVESSGQQALNALVRSFRRRHRHRGGVEARAQRVDSTDLQTSFDRGSRRRNSVDAAGDARRPIRRSMRRSIDALQANAAAKPDSYIAQLALGEALANAGDAAAYRAARSAPPCSFRRRSATRARTLLMAELAESSTTGRGR